MPGMGELLIVLVIVLLIFGAGKLPAIGDALGRSIKNFKRTALQDNDVEIAPKDSGKSELREARGADDAELLGSREGAARERERERV